MKHDIESFIETLEQSFGAIGTLKVTKTILTKGNPDANKTIVQFAKLFGINFAELEKGGDKGETLVGKFDSTGDPCKIKFYRTNTRGDYRVSISGLKKHAEAGDVIAMKRDIFTGAVVINATKEVSK